MQVIVAAVRPSTMRPDKSDKGTMLTGRPLDEFASSPLFFTNSTRARQDQCSFLSPLARSPAGRISLPYLNLLHGGEAKPYWKLRRLDSLERFPSHQHCHSSLGNPTCCRLSLFSNCLTWRDLPFPNCPRRHSMSLRVCVLAFCFR